MILTRLREIRERQALSMRALTELSGVTPTTLVRAEKGRHVYSVTVRKLAKALRVRPADLCGEAEQPSALMEAPPTVPIDERRAVLVANLLDQAERARGRGDDAGALQFEQMAAEAATANGVD
jgi:transcriptional regulator with XRE-family HTH domain